MPLFTDQIGRTILIPDAPKRIISLVPSQTELLHYLELDAAVTGITKFCVHPEQWFHSKTRVGGTKDINIPLIRSLQPDLIIAGKEENVLEKIALLWDAFPTWVSNVTNLQSALQMITAVGAITCKKTASENLVQKIQHNFENAPVTGRDFAAVYLIWRNPYMTVGGDTYIHDMMARAGFKNVFRKTRRYPVVRVSDIRASGCKVVLLSSEPYPFNEKHKAELAAALPGVTILLVDGEMFSWYGSRLLQAPHYFESLRRKLETMF